MSGFDDLFKEYTEIPLGASSAFMVELHRKSGPPPMPFMTKMARAGLLKLAMVKQSQGPEAEAALLQEQAAAQEQAMADPEAQAMVDPAIQQALDFQQAAAERDNYEQQLMQMSQQMQETEQRAQMAEQQSQQMQQAQQDTQQQLMMAQEQANTEAAGKQEAMQQAVMAKDENLQSQMAAADKREQLVATADQLKEQIEQLKQMAAVNPVQEQQMMQQQQAGMPQPDPNQPAEVQKEQQQAINAQQQAAVQGDQAVMAEQQKAQQQEQQMVAQQEQAAAQQQQAGMPQEQGMVAQSAHGMSKVDYLKMKMSASKCKCGALVKESTLGKCANCGASHTKVGSAAGRVAGFNSMKEQTGGGDKIRNALRKIVRKRQELGSTPVDEFLGKTKTAVGLRGAALLTGTGAALGGGASAAHSLGNLDSKDEMKRKALKGAGVGALAGLGASGVSKGIRAIGAKRSARKAAKERAQRESLESARREGYEAAKDEGVGRRVKRGLEKAWEVGNRPIHVRSPFTLGKTSADSMNARLQEVLASRRPFDEMPKTAVSWKDIAISTGGTIGGGIGGALVGKAENKKRDRRSPTSTEIDKKYDAMAARARAKADPTYSNKIRAAQAEREYQWDRAGREHPEGHITRRAVQGAAVGGLGAPAMAYIGKRLFHMAKGAKN